MFEEVINAMPRNAEVENLIVEFLTNSQEIENFMSIRQYVMGKMTNSIPTIVVEAAISALESDNVIEKTIWTSEEGTRDGWKIK